MENVIQLLRKKPLRKEDIMGCFEPKTLDSIYDSVACEIATMAAGPIYEGSINATVIDRTSGIDIGLFGKYNQEDVIIFREGANAASIEISHLCYYQEIAFLKIFNKKRIKSELRKLGIYNVSFNIKNDGE